MTLAMTEVLRLQTGAASIRSLTHRNLKPLFCGQPAQVRGTKQSATTWTLTLARGDQPEQPNVIVHVQLGTR
jgi:3-methylfumaryl-CoA hydratase